MQSDLILLNIAQKIECRQTINNTETIEEIDYVNRQITESGVHLKDDVTRLCTHHPMYWLEVKNQLLLSY